jgi:hypothetical protein
MNDSDIKPDSRWKLKSLSSRPDVIVSRVNIYSHIVYWSYEGESRLNESKVDYFLENYKQIS